MGAYYMDDWIPLSEGDTRRAWNIRARRATPLEVQQMITAGDISYDQANKSLRPIKVFEYVEGADVREFYYRSKAYYRADEKTARILTQAEMELYFNAELPKGITKVGNTKLTELQKDLIAFTDKIHNQNMENLGFDTNKWRMGSIN